jgi:hypothetical protein
MKVTAMTCCDLCDKQSAKSKHGAPHEYMEKFGELRVFVSRGRLGYEEQDYQCLTCHARFTHSSNKNDRAWTLWQG